MKAVLITQEGKAVGLVPGSIEVQKRPETPPSQRPENAPGRGVSGVVAGRNQQLREVEVPDELFQDTDPEEFLRGLKSAVPDIRL